MDYLDIWEGINAELFHGFSSNKISIEANLYFVLLQARLFSLVWVRNIINSDVSKHLFSWYV